MLSKVSPKGQITIPRHLRDSLSLTAGTLLVFESSRTAAGAPGVMIRKATQADLAAIYPDLPGDERTS